MCNILGHTGEKMNIEKLRKIAGREEIDYQFLLSTLSSYTSPRNKISAWLKSGDLIRIKKGLYIFGRHAALEPYSKEIIANLIYGPSAISLAYALASYGMIPERAIQVTSITNKRNKLFDTPIGTFTYQYLSNAKFSIGIELKTNPDGGSYLIASPEKALCDHLYLTDKKINLINLQDIQEYLLEDLRLDESAFDSFRLPLLEEIANAYKDSRIKLLIIFIKHWKKKSCMK